MTGNGRSSAAVEAAGGSSSFVPLPDGELFVIERPAKLNALTTSVFRELEARLDALEARGARLLVITGRGERAFSAGTDVSELATMPYDAQMKKCAFARSLILRLASSPVISVAAINGLAFGGGLEIAAACTLRIAVPAATFSLPEIKLGLLPAYAGTQLLPAVIGRSRAMEMMLTGRAIGVEEALSNGLLHRVAKPGESVVDAALAFAREVTRHSAAAIEAIRVCVDAAGPVVTEAGLAAEDRQVRSVFAGTEARKGISAFLDRREPRSRGRAG
jgi:enoyl-CoA hydratase